MHQINIFDISVSQGDTAKKPLTVSSPLKNINWLQLFIGWKKTQLGVPGCMTICFCHKTYLVQSSKLSQKNMWNTWSISRSIMMLTKKLYGFIVLDQNIWTNKNSRLSLWIFYLLRHLGWIVLKSFICHPGTKVSLFKFAQK